MHEGSNHSDDGDVVVRSNHGIPPDQKDTMFDTPPTQEQAQAAAMANTFVPAFRPEFALDQLREATAGAVSGSGIHTIPHRLHDGAGALLGERTEREQARDRLAISVEAARVGTWRFERSNRTFHGDARFARLLGLAPGGVWPSAVVLEVFREKGRGALALAIEQGDVAMQLPLNAARWVDLRGRREPDAPGDVFGIVLDVSAHTDAVRRAALLREEFLAVASHDLKSPLAAVKQGAWLLARSTNLDPRERRFVAHIRASAERMTNLIVQLLDLTRVRLGGGVPIVRQRVSVRDVIGVVVDELRLANPGRVIKVAGDGVELDVDPDRFAQVASNLIGNALKYSPETSVVSVSVAEGGEQTVFNVHNSGAPIAVDAQRLIFEPFVQLGAKGTRDGLGLGLHISREIVRSHGGTLTVSSSSVEGTALLGQCASMKNAADASIVGVAHHVRHTETGKRRLRRWARVTPVARMLLRHSLMFSPKSAMADAQTRPLSTLSAGSRETLLDAMAVRLFRKHFEDILHQSAPTESLAATNSWPASSPNSRPESGRRET